MVAIGYTSMCEQRSPTELVQDLVLAEGAGFDFSVTSDHFHPWLEEQGHSPYAWSVLGAAAARTERLPLMTYVTCPTFRYHPAVVAQKAATMQLLSEGRFRLGLGSGENLNEHITGHRWPTADIRHEMFREAIEIIRRLWEGGYVNYRGKHFSVESAKIFDLPERNPEIGVAVSGRPSCKIAGELGDALVAIDPDSSLVDMFGEYGGAGKPVVGQIGCCYGKDQGAALSLAREQFRWFAGGWKVNAELPNPVNFDAATQYVREEDVAAQLPHGPDVEPFVTAAKQFVDAGFTEVAFVQIGPDQEGFCDFFANKLKPALAKL